MKRLKTYSLDYIKMNKALHEAPKGFGGGGARHAIDVAALGNQIEAESLLDYGAGQQKLSEALKKDHPDVFRSIVDFDPAIEAISSRPKPADVVACTDVLEHIEPEYIENVLADLAQLAKKALYLEIATRPANKTLPDGRNAHLTVQGKEWWVDRLSKYWNKMSVREIRNPGKTPDLRSIIVTVFI